MKYLVGAVIMSLVADTVLKYAADARQIWILIIGAILYAVDAAFFYFAFKEIKFIDVGILYMVLTPIAVLVIGVFVFKETINIKEIIGIALGLAAIFFISSK